MSTAGWIILLVLLVPALGLLIWVVLGESFIRIPPGRLGLVLVQGRPTDRTLLSGLHFVPALRRRGVEIYPAVEMTYSGGGPAEASDREGLDGRGPAADVLLGDRSRARVGYVVRYRLDPDNLRTAHVRFGPTGLMTIVRDETVGVLASVLGRSEVGVDAFFGDRRQELQEQVKDELVSVLAADGIVVAGFWFGAVDLGRTGEVVQAIARSRFELDLEQASAAVRASAAANDRRLTAGGASGDGAEDDAWRYRENELWRELILRRETLNVTLPNGVRAVPAPPPAGLVDPFVDPLVDPAGDADPRAPR